MKTLALLLLCLFPCVSMAQWIEGTVMGVTAASPTQNAPVIFCNTFTGVWQWNDRWNTVDVSGMVPHDVKAVFLTGRLLITHGTTEETADLTIAFRAYGEHEDFTYLGQTIEAQVGSGQRSTMSVWVPVRDGKFQYKWTRKDYLAAYPDFSAYGIDLVVNAYLR